MLIWLVAEDLEFFLVKLILLLHFFSAFSGIVAMQTSGLKISFDFTKPPESPQTTIIKVSYSNLSSNLYTDFVFQAAVPKVIIFYPLHRLTRL